MTGSQPGAIVAMKIFIEQDQIAPMRVRLEFGRAAIDRALAVPVAQKDSV